MPSFLMMSAIGAASLAALTTLIPLIVHLLHRQRVTPVAWGAMQFLLESPLRVRRSRRIDNWLLMLLRMLILVLLVLALARPTLSFSHQKMVAQYPVDVAVVIDHSMTMGMRKGEGAKGTSTLYEQGIDFSEQVSRMLPTSGTMSIVLAESSPRIMTAAPLKMGLTERADDGTPRGEWARQLQILRSLKPGTTYGNIPDAVMAARDLLSHGYNTRKIIYVVSDSQRSNWRPQSEGEGAWRRALGRTSDDIDPAQDQGIPVVGISVGPPDAAGNTNVTLKSIKVQPDFLAVGRLSQIMVTVANSGGKDLASVPLVLEVDGKPAGRQQLAGPIAPGDEKTVAFNIYFPAAGSHWVRVKADVVDALDADNAAVAAVEVKQRLPVLIIDGQLTGGASGDINAFPKAGYLLAAMEVEPTINPKVISVAELATLKGVRLEDYPIVVLNDVPRLTKEAVDRLAAHAQAGNAVWMILGPRTETAFINDVLSKGGLIPVTAKGITQAPPRSQTQPGWVTVDIKDPRNQGLKLLTHDGESEHNPLGDVTLYKWWSVTPVSPDARTIVATTAGDPLILEQKTGQGKMVLWTSALSDFSWDNIPLVPNFVPLVNESLFGLASGQALQPRQVNAGEHIAWSAAPGDGNLGPTQAIDVVTVLSPDGSTHSLTPQINGDHYYVEDRDTALPGLYEMRFTAPARAGATAPPNAYFAVNIDNQELQTPVLTADDLRWFKEKAYVRDMLVQGDTFDAKAVGATLAATSGGWDIWYWIVLIILVLLVGEIFYTYVLVRQQAGKDLQDQGLDKVMPRGTVLEEAQ